MGRKNKIALITGGSRGLGRDMAMRLAERGIDVIITYQSNTEEAEKVVSLLRSSGANAEAFQLDVRDVSGFAAFVDRITDYLEQQVGSASAKLDFLINNAGTALYSASADVTEQQLDEMVDIHFKGVFFLTQQMLPHLNDGGGIINISSGLARITIPGSSVYASMKSAVETLTRYLAKELGSRRIRVNVVAPGAIETDFGGGRTRDNKEINAQISGYTALGRVGLPTDIGGVVAFLCSEDAGWINGQRLEVSGGQAL